MSGLKRKFSDEDTTSQVDVTSVKKRVASTDTSTVENSFQSGLFTPPIVQEYCEAYSSSQPYRHGVIPSLISPDLLRHVRSEITTHLSFTPKETDIYKIHQSGDLANLSGLEASSLSKLPSLLFLRDALYSPQFRNFLSQVTGCGPLSGQKTDMAINVYTPGSYLLCHDDVIGSRRVSYILYLTDPDEGKEWRAEWGGALRLYPTVEKNTGRGETANIPSSEFSLLIPPASGQLSFFEVRPGESFHDVEEVYYPDAELWKESEKQWEEETKKRTRMAISGWFHIPQKGEEGYVEGLEEKLKEMSSLNQLEGQVDELDEPKNFFTPYVAPHTNGVNHENLKGKGKESKNETADSQDDMFSESELDFLLQYLSPSYLTPDMISQISSSFLENSFLQLEQVLNPQFTATLKTFIEHEEQSSTPSSWRIATPPHKHRYQFLSPSSETSKENPLTLLLNDLLPSLTFRKWLALATSLSPSNLTSRNIIARRFRRGLDYALASSYDPSPVDMSNTNGVDGGVDDDKDDDDREGKTDPQPRLEFTFSLTPSSGWELPLPPPPSDPSLSATAPSSATAGPADPTGTNSSSDLTPRIEPGGTTVYLSTTPSSSSSNSTLPTTGSDPAIYQHSGDGDDEDDGILFAAAPGWNRLSIVLRDAGVLRFVKYVSRSAQGDVWDAVGEIEVSGLEEGDEDEDEGASEGEDAEEEGGEEGEEKWEGIESGTDDEGGS